MPPTLNLSVASISDICSKCGEAYIRGTNNGYCRNCHAGYMRKNRLKYSELSPLAKKKANCRSHANLAQRRGQLIPEPCRGCGDPNAEKHHEDYDKPLDVIWLCRKCHLALHVELENSEIDGK